MLITMFMLECIDTCLIVINVAVDDVASEEKRKHKKKKRDRSSENNGIFSDHRTLTSV